MNLYGTGIGIGKFNPVLVENNVTKPPIDNSIET
jgi:hypothetical protein